MAKLTIIGFSAVLAAALGYFIGQKTGSGNGDVKTFKVDTLGIQNAAVESVEKELAAIADFEFAAQAVEVAIKKQGLKAGSNSLKIEGIIEPFHFNVPEKDLNEIRNNLERGIPIIWPPDVHKPDFPIIVYEPKKFIDILDALMARCQKKCATCKNARLSACNGLPPHQRIPCRRWLEGFCKTKCKKECDCSL